MINHAKTYTALYFAKTHGYTYSQAQHLQNIYDNRFFYFTFKQMA